MKATDAFKTTLFGVVVFSRLVLLSSNVVPFCGITLVSVVVVVVVALSDRIIQVPIGTFEYSPTQLRHNTRMAFRVFGDKFITIVSHPVQQRLSFVVIHHTGGRSCFG